MGHTTIEAFAILIQTRKWYCKSNVLPSNASKDKKEFLTGVLADKKMQVYLLNAGWTKVNNKWIHEIKVRDSSLVHDSAKLTYLMQPNPITLMSNDYSKMMLIVLVGIIESLQDKMILKLNSKVQLDLFDYNESEKVEIKLPISSFGLAPDRYSDIRSTLRKLVSSLIEFDLQDPVTGKQFWEAQSLCTARIERTRKYHDKYVTLIFERKIAELLISVDKGYTKFVKEIANSGNSKYTMRIYWLICKWRDRDGFECKMDKLRKMLNVEKKYPRFKDFDRWILRPVRDELYQRADIWFEAAPIYTDNKVEPYKLRFKIIKAPNARDNRALELKRNTLKNYWLQAFGLSQEQSLDLLDKLTLDNYEFVMHRTIKIQEAMERNNKIYEKAAYAYKALSKEFNDTVEVLE